MVKLYCPKCLDAYTPRSSRHHYTDGAYFSTGFPHMFFMVHPEHRPQQPVKQFVARLYGFKFHSMAYQLQYQAAANFKAPTPSAAAPNSSTTTGTAAGSVVSTPATRPLVKDWFNCFSVSIFFSNTNKRAKWFQFTIPRAPMKLCTCLSFCSVFHSFFDRKIIQIKRLQREFHTRHSTKNVINYRNCSDRTHCGQKQRCDCQAHCKAESRIVDTASVPIPLHCLD